MNDYIAAEARETVPEAGGNLSPQNRGVVILDSLGFLFSKIRFSGKFQFSHLGLSGQRDD
jgi:hypothetical protein